VLSFFAGFDNIVLANIDANFSSEVGIPEARLFYAAQEANEAVHAETYAVLIDTLVKDPARKAELFKGLSQPQVEGKRLFAEEYLNTKRSFGERLVASIVIEAVLFSSSFCGIFWLRKRNLCPAVTLANDFISRDEGLHVDFGCALLSLLSSDERPSDVRIREIVRAGVDVEEDFLDRSLPINLVGINADLAKTYVRFVADRLLEQMGLAPEFKASNPFPWMQAQGMASKSNFFEKRESQYSHVTAASNKISLEDDF